MKIFLLFLLCSGAAWFVSKLSESYTSSATFDLSYINAPDTLLLVNTPKEMVDVKLRASGFQFLGFNFKNKKIRIDLDKVKTKGFTYFVPQQEYRKQIERQLSNTMELIEMDSDTLFFKFKRLYKKKVPVVPRLMVDLAQNFMLENSLRVTPDSVTITGLKEDIDTISNIRTEKKLLTDVTSSFSEKMALSKSNGLKFVKLSEQKVKVTGKVVRFSEKVIDVPVTVINLPKDVELRTFPNVISILCKAKIEQLKKLETSDFKLVVDYNSINDHSNKLLRVNLVKSPKGLHSARPLDVEVEYILKRQ
ncbi:CdaR family protein [Costertonia aggregata]|uniref:YbbR-like domain-containing protein n=1 Tax=Costertonia aggregata TaxID=343403 RepID=A0A7H9AKG5_9FLAO|nr:YbbR-like domain-containing protein [Costertonia aggregata]QLG43843.1 YbbR-like domain-containing protein [Costertonia aggregata]